MDLNCIFCHRPFVPGEIGEHIIPESIGGSLTIREVCTCCNSKLNRKFEQNFKNEFTVRMKRYEHNIRGKRKNDVPPFPFRGYVDTDISAQCQLDQDFAPSLKTDVELSKVNGDTFQCKISADAAKRAEVIKSLERKLPKCIQEIHPEFTSVQVEGEVKKLIKKVEEQFDLPENRKIVRPNLNYKFKVDLKIFMLEYAKVAYEFAFHQFGKSFLEEQIATEIQDFLCGGSDSAMQYIKGIELKEIILNYSPDKHYLFILDDKCIVSLFGYGMAIKITDSEIKKLTPMNSTIFIFDPAKKKHTSHALICHLNSQLASSFIMLLI